MICLGRMVEIIGTGSVGFTRWDYSEINPQHRKLVPHDQANRSTQLLVRTLHIAFRRPHSVSYHSVRVRVGAENISRTPRRILSSPRLKFSTSRPRRSIWTRDGLVNRPDKNRDRWYALFGQAPICRREDRARVCRNSATPPYFNFN